MHSGNTIIRKWRNTTNKEGRKSLKDINDQLEELKDAIEILKNEEEDYKCNIPENLWNSEKYEKASGVCDNLDNAVSSLEEVISDIEEAME